MSHLSTNGLPTRVMSASIGLSSALQVGCQPTPPETCRLPGSISKTGIPQNDIPQTGILSTAISSTGPRNHGHWLAVCTGAALSPIGRLRCHGRPLLLRELRCSTVPAPPRPPLQAWGRQGCASPMATGSMGHITATWQVNDRDGRQKV